MAPSNTTAPKTTGSNGKSESTYNEKEKPRQILDCNIPSPKATAVCDAIKNTLGPKKKMVQKWLVMNKMEGTTTPPGLVMEEPSPQANINSGRIEELMRLADAHDSLALALEQRAVAERRLGKAVENRLLWETRGLQHKAAAERELAAAIEHRVASHAREAEALSAGAWALEAQNALWKEVPTTPVVVKEEPSPQASSRADLEEPAVDEKRLAWILEFRAVGERELALAIKQRVAAQDREKEYRAALEAAASAREAAALRVPPWTAYAAAVTTNEMTQRLNKALKAQDAPRTVDRHISGIAKSQYIEAGDETTGNPTVNPLDSRAKFIPFQKGTIFLQGDDGVTVTHKGPIVWFDTGRRDKNSMPSRKYVCRFFND